MSTPALVRQGHRLIQIGAALFLLTSLEAFAIPFLAAPPLARSVHVLAGLTGVIAIALGLIWPRLKLGERVALLAFGTFLYSASATIAIFLLGAIWGAGNATIPLAAGAARGTDLQEGVIAAIAYSAGPTALIAFSLILWGLRGLPDQSEA